MTARVVSGLTNAFVKYIDGETGVFDLNEHFLQVQEAINFIIKKIINRGYNMKEMRLQQISNIGEAVEVFNANTATINSYLVSIARKTDADYLLSKEILSTMRIDAVNNNTQVGIAILPESIELTLGNGQQVSLTEGKVSSTLDEEVLVVSHA